MARCEADLCKRIGTKRTISIPIARYALGTKLLVNPTKAVFCDAHFRRYEQNFNKAYGDLELVEQKGGVDISKVAVDRV